MLPFLVLIVSLFAFRGLGLLGVPVLTTWQDSASYALALMLALTASAHFTPMKKDLIAMVPKKFPNPALIVTITGILEILGAIGLLIPVTRSVAGVCLALLMLSMFPANVYAAIKQIPLRGKAPTPLWQRIPMQIIFIGVALWVAL